MNDDSLDILKRVQSGEMSVEDGAARLEAVESTEAAGASTPPPQARYEPTSEDISPDLGWWGSAWQILFWTGTAILALGAVMMGWAYSFNRHFWFYCSWLPMLLGTFVLLLGWWSQRARWIHVRVNGADGKRVSISIPLPLSLASWLLRVFGRWIPGIKEQNLGDLPTVLDALEKADGPVIVDVDDKDGDKVKIYII